MTRPRFRIPLSEPLPARVWVYFCLAGVGLALLLALLLVFQSDVRRSGDVRAFLLKTDYPPFLTGARLVAAGRGAELYNLAAQTEVQTAMLAPYQYAPGIFPYNHLPFLAVALSPLAGWSLQAGYALWFGLTTGALIVALVLLGRDMREAARDAIERRWAPRALALLAFGFFPIYNELLNVQTATWTLLAFVLMIRALRQEREVAAGLALAVVLIKPQLLIVPLGVLLLTRRWRALASFAGAAAAAALLITPLLGGPGWVGQWLGVVAGVAGAQANTGAIQPPLMESLRGQFTLLAAKFDPSVADTGAAGWVLPLTALVSLAVLALVAWSWWGRPRAWAADPAGWDARWAAGLLATLLINPHGLPYELTLWLLPAVLAWRAARERGVPAAVPRLVPWLVGGFLLGTLTLPLVLLVPGWPLHLGALFMLAAVPWLIIGRRSPAGNGLAAG